MIQNRIFISISINCLKTNKKSSQNLKTKENRNYSAKRQKIVKCFNFILIFIKQNKNQLKQFEIEYLSQFPSIVYK
jgi:hypothetical protein